MGLDTSGARAGLGSEFLAAQHFEESKLGDDVPHAPVGAISRKGVCWTDRQAPSTQIGRMQQGDRAAASAAHTISLWKIPSIDSALIRQAALGIPPRFLLGWVRSKRESGWGLEPRLPFPSIQMRLSLLGNRLQSHLVLPSPGAAGSGSKGGERPHIHSLSLPLPSLRSLSSSRELSSRPEGPLILGA